MATPEPAMMRITDGRHVKADAPAVKSRAFQLTIEEARATQEVSGRAGNSGFPLEEEIADECTVSVASVVLV